MSRIYTVAEEVEFLCAYIENIKKIKKQPNEDLDEESRKLLHKHQNFIPNNLIRERVEKSAKLLLNYKKQNDWRKQLVDDVFYLIDLQDFKMELEYVYEKSSSKLITLPEECLRNLLVFYFKQSKINGEECYKNVDYIMNQPVLNNVVDNKSSSLINDCHKFFLQFIKDKQIKDPDLICLLRSTFQYFIWKLICVDSENHIKYLVKFCYRVENSQQIQKCFLDNIQFKKNQIYEKIFKYKAFPNSSNDYILLIKLAHNLKCTPAYLLGLTDLNNDLVYKFSEENYYRAYQTYPIESWVEKDDFIEFMTKLENMLGSNQGKEKLRNESPEIYEKFKETSIQEYISIRIKTQLNRRLTKQKDFAIASKVSKDRISKYIHKKLNQINYNEILKMGVQLQCTPDYLVGLSEDRMYDRFGSMYPIDDSYSLAGVQSYNEVLLINPDLAELLKKCSKVLNSEDQNEVKAILVTYLNKRKELKAIIKTYLTAYKTPPRRASDNKKFVCVRLSTSPLIIQVPKIRTFQTSMDNIN